MPVFHKPHPHSALLQISVVGTGQSSKALCRSHLRLSRSHCQWVWRKLSKHTLFFNRPYCHKWMFQGTLTSTLWLKKNYYGGLKKKRSRLRVIASVVTANGQAVYHFPGNLNSVTNIIPKAILTFPLLSAGNLIGLLLGALPLLTAGSGSGPAGALSLLTKMAAGGVSRHQKCSCTPDTASGGGDCSPVPHASVQGRERQTANRGPKGHHL